MEWWSWKWKFQGDWTCHGAVCFITGFLSVVFDFNGVMGITSNGFGV